MVVGKSRAVKSKPKWCPFSFVRAGQVKAEAAALLCCFVDSIWNKEADAEPRMHCYAPLATPEPPPPESSKNPGRPESVFFFSLGPLGAQTEHILES